MLSHRPKHFWSRPGYKSATLSKMPSGQARSNAAAAKGDYVCSGAEKERKFLYYMSTKEKAKMH